MRLWSALSATLAACSSAPSTVIDSGAVLPDSGVLAPDGGALVAPDSGVDVDGGVACVPATSNDPLAVTTRFGAVRGLERGTSQVFFAIPFAAPPTGALRWRPPAAPECWSDVRTSAELGPACPQFRANDQIDGDENCLQLNLWRPAATSTAPRPVMVFFHGGGNIQGSTRETAADGTYLYDGEKLSAATGAIVVTANYRLGVFGFLAHSSLSAESPENASGNYGILDQIAALEWVRDNISAFGGNSSQVMIFGESAGARDVCVLLASPLARGLFHGALMQSGGCGETTLAEREEQGEEIMAQSPCADAECLRGLDTETVLRLKPGVIDVATGRETDYGAAVDGWVLPRAPLEVVERGEHNAVPLIVGSNEDETARSVGRLDSCQAYEQAVRTFLPAAGSAALGAYPCLDYPTPRAAFIALTSDLRFICPVRTIARTFAARQTAPVYRYFFTHDLENTATPLGAYHGLELAFVFGFLNVANYQPSPGEIDLSTSMQRWWGQFARGVAPDGWPRYDAVTDAYFELATPPMAGQGVRTAQCDFWESLF